MNVEELCERELPGLLAQAREHFDDDPGHDAQHALRVARWTLRLTGAEVPARLTLAAAVLHDVVNLPKDSPERALASERSASVAREWLPRWGFSPHETELVAEAIRDHSYSRGATPRTLLGCALQDADRLEAVGALGLMRCLSAGARMRAAFFHPTDPWATARLLDDHQFSVDHLFTKLLGLAETMNTEGGRREARRRIVFLRSFLGALASEIEVPLTDER